MPNKNDKCPKCGAAVSKDSSFMLCLPCCKITTLENEVKELEKLAALVMRLSEARSDRKIHHQIIEAQELASALLEKKGTKE